MFDPAKLVLSPAGVPVFGEDKQPMTLGAVAVMALLRPVERSAEAEQIGRFSLAMKVSAATDPMILKDTESVMLRKAVAVLGSPLLMGRIAEELDGPPLADAAE